MLTIVALTVLGLGQHSGLQYLHASAVYGLEAGPAWSPPLSLDETAELVVRGVVTGVSSQFINDTVWSRAEVSVDTVEKGTAVTKVVVEYQGGEVGDIQLVVSNQPKFRVGEHVLLYLVRGTGDNFKVAGGPAGKILLDPSGKVLATAESGYIYTGLHWPSGNVRYYVNVAGGPAGALLAVQRGFEVWNTAGAAFSFVYGGGGLAVRWAYVDGPGHTLAVTYVWSSSYIVYSCETVFDTAESWATDSSPNKLDVQNVAAHEAGHWLVLDDLYQSQYSEMTMYGYASPGETKKRTLEWGDIAGIQFIYPSGPTTYTVTFYTDPTSGTITADGVTKMSGTTETYSSGAKIRVIANPPSGYSFSYWWTIGVSVDNPFSEDTYMTVSNTGSLEAYFAAAHAPPPEGSFFHPYTEFWFSSYDMRNAQWDAIHIVNIGNQNATVQIYMDGVPMEDTPISIPAGRSTYRTYPGSAGGPVHIVSDQLIWATQRILGWTAMQEIYGMPDDAGSIDVVFTWYDLVGATTDDIYVINPSKSETASVGLFVAGVPRGQLTIGPGQSGVTNFPGVIGGPLRIRSTIPVLASQRVIGFDDFAEIIGLPSSYTFTETWFNWYDMQGASWDAIHMLNPSTSTANVDVYVGGTLRASLSLGPGAADYRTFPGLVGGPVRIVSTQPIWVTQRIVGWGGWKEVFGVPTVLATTNWYFTWYDMQGAQWDAIHFINPGSSDAQVQVYVGGQLRGTVTVHAGEAVHVTYPGLMAGPVQIVSNVPIMSSQRILGWQSFEETIGASLA